MRIAAQVAGDYHGGMSLRKAAGRSPRRATADTPRRLDLLHLRLTYPEVQGKAEFVLSTRVRDGEGAERFNPAAAG